MNKTAWLTYSHPDNNGLDLGASLDGSLASEIINVLGGLEKNIKCILALVYYQDINLK